MKEERAAPKAVTSTTSDAASGVTAGEDNAASEATAAPSTSASDQASTTTKDKDADAEETKGGNLVGKINNLISSDLENIVEMTELPIVVVYTPIKIALSVWFLYLLLGWRYGGPLFGGSMYLIHITLIALLSEWASWYSGSLSPVR